METKLVTCSSCHREVRLGATKNTDGGNYLCQEDEVCGFYTEYLVYPEEIRELLWWCHDRIFETEWAGWRSLDAILQKINNKKK